MDGSGKWIADKVKNLTDVKVATVITPQRVEIVRTEFPPIIVGTTAVEHFDEGNFVPFLTGEPSVSFIVNITKEASISGEALRLSEAHRIPIGGVGDLMRAIAEEDVRQYVYRDVQFITRGLTQHSRIASYTRLDDKRYLLKRRGLQDVQVIFLYEYELTADHVRTARSRYGMFSMLVNTHPYGRATSSAHAAAVSIETKVYDWSEFLSALHRK